MSVPTAHDLQPSCVLIRVPAERIRGLAPPADISGIMQRVEDLLDSSIAAEGYVIREPAEEYGTDHRIDLSGIDFEALKTRFEQGRKYTEAERVKGVVAWQPVPQQRSPFSLAMLPVVVYNGEEPGWALPSLEEPIQPLEVPAPIAASCRIGTKWQDLLSSKPTILRLQPRGAAAG